MVLPKKTELINQSIESYLYCILGAQARTKQSIYSNRASALDTQQEFRSIVEDSIINYNVSTWINNMNGSITGTNVVLNLAIWPNLWLILSNLNILKNPIKSYNNKLRVVRTNMKFVLIKNLIILNNIKSWTSAMDWPDGKRNLKRNIKAQQNIFTKAIESDTEVKS